ncbi:helix-turn-helix domain-containing protein [Bordetella avium]
MLGAPSHKTRTKQHGCPLPLGTTPRNNHRCNCRCSPTPAGKQTTTALPLNAGDQLSNNAPTPAKCGLCFGGDMAILTPADVAVRLRVSPNTARRLAAPGGPIPCYRVGRQIRFQSSDVEEYENSCRSTSIKAAVDIALSSTALSPAGASGLRNFFQKHGLKLRQTHSTGRKAAASTR